MKQSLNTGFQNTLIAILTASFFLFLPPSVFSQKIINQQTGYLQMAVLKIGGGIYQPYLDGRKGVSFGMSYEKAFHQNWSWLVNTDLMFNPTDDDLLLRGLLRPTIQSRFVFHPELRFYPRMVLQRFHVGIVAGFVGGYGKGTGAINPDGTAILRSFTEELAEIKLGWQQPFRKAYLWNIFAAVGVLYPNEKVYDDLFFPVFRLGLLVGTQK